MKALYIVTVDNSAAQSHNINIDRPEFITVAESKEEAIGKMMLSDFSYKHKNIVNVTAAL